MISCVAKVSKAYYSQRSIKTAAAKDGAGASGKQLSSFNEFWKLIEEKAISLVAKYLLRQKYIWEHNYKSMEKEIELKKTSNKTR